MDILASLGSFANLLSKAFEGEMCFEDPKARSKIGENNNGLDKVDAPTVYRLFKPTVVTRKKRPVLIHTSSSAWLVSGPRRRGAA